MRVSTDAGVPHALDHPGRTVAQSLRAKGTSGVRAPSAASVPSSVAQERQSKSLLRRFSHFALSSSSASHGKRRSTEVRMHELHDHRALADCGSASLR
jgi:hypothetical protein